MKRLLLACLVALPALPAATAGDQPSARDALVRELIARAVDSRVLDNVHFTVPITVWHEYVRQMTGEPPPRDPAPVPMIASEAEYRLTVDVDHPTRVAATVHLHVFRPDECRNVPILSAKLAWEKVTVNDVPADLATADGWLRLSPAEPGEVVVTAQAALPQPFQLDLPVVRTVRTFLGFDSEQAWEVSEAGDPRRIVGTVAEPRRGTHGRLALTPRDRLKVSCERPRIQSQRPPRYQLTGDVVWTLDAGTQQVAANLAVAIVGGSTERIDVVLPPSAERVTVTGPDVRDVQVASGVAAVFLRGRIRERTRLAVRFRIPSARGGVQRLAGLAVRDGHWSGGTLVVANAVGGSEVLAQTANGLHEVSLSQIPASAASMMAAPPALAYDITSRSWSAEVETLDLGAYALRETVADIAHYEVAVRGDGSLMCKADYEVRNRTQQFLRFDLPAGAHVLMVRVNEVSQPLTPVAGEADAYLVPLVRSKATVKGLVSFPVEIVVLYRTAPLSPRGRLALPLPRVNLPIAYAWCEAYLPDGVRPARWFGPMAHVERYSSETATASLTYGHGEMAEGYTEAERHVVDVEGEKAIRTGAGGRQPGPDTILYPFAQRAPKPERGEPSAAPEDIIAATPDVAEAAQGGKAPVLGDVPVLGSLFLARNYFRAGRDFYDKGDFSNAAKSLEQVRKLAPGSTEAANAERLLANVGYATDKLQAKSQAEKVAGAQVTHEIAAANIDVAQQQERFLEEGRMLLRQGRQDDAKARLEAAKALGEQLLAQGVGRREQKVRVRQAEQQIAQIRDQQKVELEGIRSKAALLKERGDYKQALEVLQRGVQKGDVISAEERVELAYLAQKKKADKARSLRGRQAAVARSGRQPVTTVETLDGVTTRTFTGFQADDRAPAAAEAPMPDAARPGVPPPPRPVFGPAHREPKAADAIDAFRRTDIPEEGARKAADAAARLQQADALWTDSQKLAREQKYAEAATVLDQVLTLQPDHKKAQRFRDDYRYLSGLATQIRERRQGRSATTALNDADASSVPWSRLHRYPSQAEWEQQSRSRRVTAAAAPEQSFVTEAAPTHGDLPVRSYRVGDLMKQIPDAGATVPRMNLSEALRQGGVGGGGAQSLFEDSATTDDAETAAERLKELVERTVRSDEPWKSMGGHATMEFDRTSGTLHVRQTPEGHRRLQELMGTLAGQPSPKGEKPSGAAASLVTQVYNIPTGTGDQKMQKMLTDIVDSDGDRPNLVKMLNGNQLVVSATTEQQKRVSQLLRSVEAARGPQVEMGKTLATQRATRGGQTDERLGLTDDLDGAYDSPTAALRDKDKLATDSWSGVYWVDGRDVPSQQAPAPQRDPEFERFVDGNYTWGYWSWDTEAAGRAKGRAAAMADVARKLRLNLGQKVQVNSINLNFGAASAATLGVRFTSGANGLRYGTIDEAQFRTLSELSSRRPASAGMVDENLRRQETIVGTAALLANGMVADVTFAADADNTLDVVGNSLKLEHQRYVLIDNGRYLTAVRADRMQHWTETPSFIPFAPVPQTIEVPRVGQRVKLEKTLVEPTDELVIRADYVWKGAMR